MPCLRRWQPGRSTHICRHGRYRLEEAAITASQRNCSSMPCLRRWQPGRSTQICRHGRCRLEEAAITASQRNCSSMPGLRQRQRCTLICRRGPRLGRGLPLHLEAAAAVCFSGNFSSLPARANACPSSMAMTGSLLPASSARDAKNLKNNGMLQNAASATGSRRRKRLQSACHDNAGFTSSTMIQWGHQCEDGNNDGHRFALGHQR